LSFQELAKAVQGQLITAGASSLKFQGVAIDSRAVKPGELFIAIRGARNDGHNFMGQALERGAAGVLADTKFDDTSRLAERTAVIVVNDTHEAMIQLAQNYRRKCKTKIIGITGSNGKTTTKEFTFALLSAVERKVYRSPGNLNNLFGAPLALFGMPQDTKAAVMEMGISSKGEMTRLTNIVQPDVAVITNVGPSHLEFLSTVEDVARAKLEMVTTSASEIPLVVNADDQLLANEAKKVRDKFVTFGVKNNADFQPTSIESTSYGNKITIGRDSFAIKMFGRHAIYNLLAAYAACRTLSYSFAGIDTMCINLVPAAMRGEVLEKNGVWIINDSYNANPESVKAGLEAFKNTPGGGRRILILGDMLELGQRSEKYHRELGNSLVNQNFDLAIIVGDWNRAVLEGARQAGVSQSKLRSFKNSAEAATGINLLVKSGDIVYIKGSRGVSLEKIIEKIGTAGDKI